MKTPNASFNHEKYLQDARNLYRQETEKKRQDALIECFTDDFSHLNQEQQKQMKKELVAQMQEIKEQLHKGKDTSQLKKDWRLFSLLAKKLNITDIPQLTNKGKASFNDFFEKNKEQLVGKNIWIDGEKRRITHINKNGALQLKKISSSNKDWQQISAKNKKSDFRTISSFAQLKNLGQVNGAPDQNNSKEYKYTWSEKEKETHQLLQDLFAGEKEHLEAAKATPLAPLPIQTVEIKEAPKSKAKTPKALGEYVDFVEIKDGQEKEVLAAHMKEVNELIEIFDDADYGVGFANFCEENGITRADGREIKWRGSMDTTAEYIDREGNILKLKAVKGGADQHDDTGAYTEYHLIKVKQITKPDLEQEKKEENPESINEFLPVVAPKEQEIIDEPLPAESPEKEAPETIDEPLPVSTPKEEEPAITTDESYNFSLNAAISDTLLIHEEQARLAAEESLKAEYAQVNKRNVFKRGALFLSRGRKRKKLIEEMMKNSSTSAFGSLVEDAADRHSREHQLKMSNVNEKSLVSLPEVNQLAREFIQGSIDEFRFQAVFDKLCTDNPQLKTALENITHKGTNILHLLKVEKAQYQLVEELAKDLETGSSLTQVQSKIEGFISTYQTNPDFLKTIAPDLNEQGLEKLKKYFKHQATIRKSALKNLELKLSIFDSGKSAYQIDNSDREKGRIYKLGKRLDKMPAWAQVAGYTGAGVLLGMAGGPLGLGVVGTSILTTTTFAGMSGFTNFVKKRTHYTKEQNTHEKNLTHDFDKQQKQIQQWESDLAQKGAKNRRKRYRAKRKLALYRDATQQNVVKTQDFVKDILAFSTSMRPLSESDKAQLLSLMMQAKTRLDAYRETGHNFLASNSTQEVESDMNQLYKALQLGADKLNITFDQINEQKAVVDGQELNYQEHQKALLSDYANANKQFRSQRRWLAGKYGIGSAALSAGTSFGFQALMGTGAFATESTLQTEAFTSQANGSAEFGLGGHTLESGNQIQTTVSDQLSNLSENAKVAIDYGAGTDGVALRAGSALASPDAYQAKLDAVADQIRNLALSADQKEAFLDQIANRPWEADWSRAFTNDYLQGDRCAEGLLQIAKGLEASGNQTLVPELAYNTGKSIAGSSMHNAGERIFEAGMQITEQVTSGQAGSGSTWRVPVFSFHNTFKSPFDTQETDEKSTTTPQEKKEEKADPNSVIPSEKDKKDQAKIAIPGAEPRTHVAPTEAGKKDQARISIPGAALAAPGVVVASPTLTEEESNSEKKTTKEKLKEAGKKGIEKTKEGLQVIKAGAINFWDKTKEKAKQGSQLAKEKYQEKAPQIKASAQKAREKTKEGARNAGTKIKETRNNASEKMKEKAPVIKENSQKIREKTKEGARNLSTATREKIGDLKNRLFATEESTDEEIESGFESFDNYPKSKETLAFLNNNSTFHITQNHERMKFKGFIPNQHLNIAGRDVYLTPLLEGDYVVAYVEDNGELVPRLFRKSNSGGNWHAVPGYDNGGSRISKGEFVSNISYEKGTVVTKEFNQILDSLPDENIGVNMQDVMKKIYGKNIPNSANFNGEKEYKNMPKSAQEYYDETVVFDELLSEWNPNTTRDSAFNNYKNTDQIKEYYDKINLEKRMDFSSSQIVESYTSHHKYLGDIENQVMTVKIKSSNPDFDGREVLVTIATAKNDGLSRVENIVFSDDRGTSFLTQRNPVSGGLLTTKPLEYLSQVPQFVRDNPTLPEYGNYVDIRPLMQNNPLIKEWKKLQS